jgi:hypothetical protein
MPNLVTHFLVDHVEDFPNGSKRAYIVWAEDTDGRFRKMADLNVAQLNEEILQQPDSSSPGRGWHYFLVNLKAKYYLKD